MKRKQIHLIQSNGVFCDRASTIKKIDMNDSPLYFTLHTINMENGWKKIGIECLCY